MDETTAVPAGRSVSSRWWLPIAVLVALIPLLALFALVLPPDAFNSVIVAPISLVGFTLVILSPVFVYYDRQYLAGTSEWQPSWWYYLMPLPLIGYLLSVAYIYRRHEHLGVP